MTEVWKPIFGFPDYEISNLGRVRSFKNFKQKILKPQKYRFKYFGVGLRKNGKTYQLYVHRLVLENFVDECPLYKECAHINGQHTDNRLINLKWASSKENSSHRFLHGTNNRPTFLNIDCSACGKSFLRNRKIIKYRKKLGQKSFYCSKCCANRKRA